MLGMGSLTEVEMIWMIFRILGFHGGSCRLDEGVGSVQVAPEGRLKILHLVVQQRTTGWPPALLMRM